MATPIHTDYYSVPSHEFTEGSTTEATHCHYCDHECSVEQEICCYCKEEFFEDKDTHPPRTRKWVEEEEKSDGTFHKFCELPAELRIRIWKLALPRPRVVFLEACYLECVSIPTAVTGRVQQNEAIIPFELAIEETESSSSWVWNTLATPIGFRSYCNFPVPFVCREAFDIASEIYTVAFGSDASFPTTWFDFKYDTLYLDFGWIYRTEYNLRDIYDLAKVESLALFTPEYHADLTSPENDIKDAMASFVCDTILPVFKSLKTLSFILKRHDPGETTNLIFDPKVYDVDQCIAFYSKPFDASLMRVQYELRAHKGILVPSRSQIARLANARSGQDLQLSEISLGVITTPSRKQARETAYNSWMLQKMACSTPPLEYRFMIYCYDSGTPQTMLPERFWRLGFVKITVVPETPVHVLDSKLREYWSTSDSTELILKQRGFEMRQDAIVGHLEHLTPQERNGPEGMTRVGRHSSFFEFNTVYVSFIERATPVIKRPLEPSASNLILHEWWSKNPRYEDEDEDE